MAKPDKDELLSAEIKKVLDESPYNDNYGVPRMAIYPIYPGPNLSKRNYKEGLLPYLLRKLGMSMRIFKFTIYTLRKKKKLKSVKKSVSVVKKSS